MKSGVHYRIPVGEFLQIVSFGAADHWPDGGKGGPVMKLGYDGRAEFIVDGAGQQEGNAFLERTQIQTGF